MTIFRKITTFLLVLGCCTSTYAQIEFESGYNLNIGGSPYGMAVGDFNNDGFNDMVSSNYTNTASQRVSVIMNNKDGTFFNNNLSATGTAIAVDTADLNKDGNLDIVVALQGSDAIGVYLGNGNGTFSNTEYAAGDGPNDIAVGDFNEDGNLDVATVSRFSDDMYVYLGDGNGALNPPATFSLNPNAEKIAVGDFNKDNHLDLLVGADTDVDFYAGDGNGNFAAAITSTGYFGFKYMNAADINDDGNLDILANSSTLFYRLIGSGDGTFTYGGYFPIGRNVNTYGDFDEDGNVDCVSQVNLRLSLYPGDGTGNFPDYRQTFIDNGGFAMCSGDLNNDGHLDVAVAGGSAPGVVTVSYGKGNGFFRGPSEFPLVPTTYGLEKTDLNNDGETDLIAGSGGNMNVYFGKADGTFTPGLGFNVGFPFILEALNINSDGFIDIAALDPTANMVKLYRGDGTGILTFAGSFDVTADQHMTLGDVNKDNITDIICSGTGGNIEIFRGNGDETFTLILDLNVGEFVYAALVEDIDEDTNPDIICVVDPTVGPNQARFFKGDGTGGFTPAGTPLDLNQGGRALASGDVDKNGHIDFITVGNGADGDILLGDGTFLFSASVRSGSVGSLNTAAFADIDGDGNDDIVFGSSIGGVAIYTGAGDGTFPVYAYRILGAGGFRLIAEDFNNDGQVDIATLLSGGNDALGIHLNSTAPPVCVPVQVTGGPGSNTFCEGISLNLTVNTSGDLPITYQWQKDGADIPGATSSSLPLPSITAADGGSYVCNVSNTCGTDSSTPSVITVLAAPQPPTTTGATACMTGSLTLTASGGTNGEYRWYDAPTGGSMFPGEFNSSFTTPSISSTTDYYVAINNGSCESSRVQVTAAILTPVLISLQPMNQTVAVDGMVTLSVTASGDNLTYQWQKDGSDINGANADTYIISSAQIGDSGSYTCLVSNDCSAELSTEAVVTVGSGSVGFSVFDNTQGQALVNGQVSPVDLGTTNPQTPLSREFEIRNSSASSLLINDIFTTSPFMAANIPSTIDASSSDVFTIEFQGSQMGIYGTNVRIDTDAGLFVFPVEARVSSAQGELIIYNGLAPDGDGRNDFFKIENIETFPDNRVRIFNKWGELVFEITGYDNSANSARFEGRSNVSGSKDLLEGSYFYVIEFGGERLSGHLFLRR